MTYRELELYIEGQEEARGWIRELMAWVQANLMNIHIPRGKPKVKPAQLLPRRDRRRRAPETDEDAVREIEAALGPLEATQGDPQARMTAAKVRAREKQDRSEWRAFRESSEGRRLAELIGDDEE